MSDQMMTPFYVEGPAVVYVNDRHGVILLDHDQAEARINEMSPRDRVIALGLARLAVARLERVTP